MKTSHEQFQKSIVTTRLFIGESTQHGNMSTTCFHVCIPSTLWRHPSGLPLSGFGLLLSRALPFGANTCRGSSSWASWPYKMTTQLLMCIFGPPNFKHEQSNPNSTKTPQREGKLMNMCEGRKRANLVPPLLCTTLRLGATGLGLGLSLLWGCSHSKKTVVFHSQLTRVSAGTMGPH